MTTAAAATVGARTVHPWFVWIAVAALIAGIVTVFVLPGGASDGPASPAFVRAAIRHARKPAARHLVDVLVPRVAIYPDQPLTRSEVLIALWDAERVTSRGRLRQEERRERLLLAQRDMILTCRSDLDLEISHEV